MANPSDAFLHSVAHIAVDGDAYYADPDPAKVACTWRQAASAAGSIGVVASPGFDTSADGPHHFAQIVDALELLVVEAYDGDGVIYVERTRRHRDEPPGAGRPQRSPG